MSTPLAAWALGLGGLGQVLRRLGYPRLTARTGPRGRAALILGLLAATSAVFGGPARPGRVARGGGGGRRRPRGVHAAASHRAVRPLAPEVYGRPNGLLQAPATVAIALGPAAGSGPAAAFGGYPPLFVLLAAVALAAVALTVGTAPTSPRTTEP